MESRQGFSLFFQISFFFLRFAYSQRSFWQCHFVMVLRTKSIGSNGSGAFGNQWSIAWISLWDDCQLSWWNNTISSSSGSLVHYQISRVECRWTNRRSTSLVSICSKVGYVCMTMVWWWSSDFIKMGQWWCKIKDNVLEGHKFHLDFVLEIKICTLISQNWGTIIFWGKCYFVKSSSILLQI